MERINFVESVSKDFPELRFREGERFAFRPPRTVILQRWNDGNEAEYKIYQLRLLHEVGHATLGHRDFKTDVERLKMERAAWEQAREFCTKYGVQYDEDFVETELDSYRDWLEVKSRCPKCGMTRVQTAEGKYICPLDDL